MTSVLSDTSELAAVVDLLLSRLVACQRARALDSVVALFTDDAMMFGSAVDESAVGTEDIRRFFRERFALSVTYGWTWEDLVVQGDGSTISFVANGSYDLRGPSERDYNTGIYRIAGVLRRDGDEWKIALFSGCQPVESSAL